MRLHEHPEFQQAVLAAAEHFQDRGLRPAFIEKDYYVTEALRVIADTAGDKVIFKGGTSLSKGWNLIQRFSEDIDLFLDPEAFNPPLGTNAIDRQLKKLRDAITLGAPLIFEKGRSRTFGGFGRSDYFSYETHFWTTGEVAPGVLLEAGIGSGREPTASMMLNSFAGQFLIETGRTLKTENERPFSMRLLHYRRTFVEKMFAIHKTVELYKRNGAQVGGHARHYYDLYQLAAEDEVQRMLRSDEYGKIKNDYDRISRQHFPTHYSHPPDMRFAGSDALFPTGRLLDDLGAEYDMHCLLLCFGPFPKWREVLDRFETMRDIL